MQRLVDGKSLRDHVENGYYRAMCAPRPAPLAQHRLSAVVLAARRAAAPSPAAPAARARPRNDADARGVRAQDFDARSREARRDRVGGQRGRRGRRRGGWRTGQLSGGGGGEAEKGGGEAR
jgi:uncharacterized membrane protein YgcG